MRISLSITAALAALAALPAATRGSQLRSAELADANANTDAAHDDKNSRTLAASDTICKGLSLASGEKLEGGESICGVVDGEMVYYGVRTYSDNPKPGYTLYRLEIWSEFGTHDRRFRGIGTTGEAPFLKLQGDGHLVFARNSATGDCYAKPNKRGSAIEARIEGPLPDLVKVRDDDGDIVWTLSQKTRSNGNVYIGGSSCYPEIGPRCVGVLREREKLTWNEFVCDFDSSGDAVSRFGLDNSGLLALWRDDELVWRPGPGHIRGDYLRLQGDGHLTLYRDTEPSLTYKWRSQCFGDDTKLTLSDGDVHQFNQDGSVVWSLAGEGSLEPICLPGCK